MKNAIKLLSLLFILNLVLFSCTIQDETDDSTEVVTVDPNKKDPNPPVDPND
ncbi:hypothetical protein Q4Q34_08880 [Flavivirga abyssicola]|uniref:hypothetical protein n=1 Tax=Flavivirga abyssicola TaxID=3063533 RepID=UPI0026E001A2|nr:hypothetical protein [Flavivirga sp. MEBiC07777]WVK15141.1 hypothetical protein Q4Q34_08880 [Flavivirga sp. MEBiC07777]